ncbi:hypothetical protein M3629_06220 [Paenibacillus polysaccharolyticus]|uniref:hypothetical protein n=1 Tax=Paenibacillus polysaccharolyticus TaxID=582692 RepID=UPI00203D024A|nr:hypothetical protein [Paenibacillus polysaccharolyticus]MCM3132371.1 hypothetical protein [Paenibacillus polysaccharolyticus]
MSIERIGIDGENMTRDGKWFTTWIITGSDAAPNVSLADINGVHVETVYARGQKFDTLPGDPLGVSLRGFCKSDVPSNCAIAINLEQDGLKEHTVTKPNN